MNLTNLFEAVIALAAALISAFFIPWLRRHTSAADREAFLKWVEIAVAAAEQLYNATDGAKKKAYVLNYLSGKGYTVTESDVDNAIEAAVLRLHKEIAT